MAFDQALCEEKHRGVNSSLNRLWGIFTVIWLSIASCVGYSIVQAQEAKATALSTKVDVDSKFERIINLLEQK